MKVAAARPDLCHFALDPTASSSLWNIAMFEFRDLPAGQIYLAAYSSLLKE